MMPPLLMTQMPSVFSSTAPMPDCGARQVHTQVFGSERDGGSLLNGQVLRGGSNNKDASLKF
jgi:hypothetical protein